MAFALWSVEHAELADDVHAVRNAMRCTEPHAHALIRGLREARKRPARPPKARALRRRAERLGSLEPGRVFEVLPRPMSAGEIQDALRYFAGPQVGDGAESGRVDVEPDVAAYVAASVGAAELPARPARCATGHSTCTRAHLGIGGQCHAGRCHVHAADVAAGQGVESLAHG